MRLIGKNRDGARYHLWPISFGIHPRGWLAKGYGTFIDWHGWQTGFEDVPHEKTSTQCMPGKRAVFGQTVHIGRLFIRFGRPRRSVTPDAATSTPPPQAKP